MVHGLVDAIALEASHLALSFVVRVKKTYFLDSRNRNHEISINFSRRKHDWLEV